MQLPYEHENEPTEEDEDASQVSGGVCGRGSFFSVSFCVPSVSLMSQCDWCALLVSPRVRWFFVLRCWRAIFSHLPDLLALRD